MWGYQNMMNWGGSGGFGLLGGVFGLVILIDAILFGIWMWKQIQKK